MIDKQDKDNQQPLMVSIRCAVYNHELYIRKCLEGFVMQKTNFRFEAIVHDDASTDGSAAIIKEFAEKYPDIIKPIFEKENQYSKHDGSLGRIMDENSHGKYIAFCEGDDYWTDPLKLQKQIDFWSLIPIILFVFIMLLFIGKMAILKTPFLVMWKTENILLLKYSKSGLFQQHQ